ncbi:hypothetical protein EKD16_09340 [Streptomonospora litoralis]|uniref:Uncharacterized protein n=1 Tax=Streptomonospora litoralis TaxID=2498135 RepID=A0A4V0ZJJ1_9ACTN|nr:hypothetical protein EKD16_09340 [Streptomonospora litoralis]
MTRHIPCIPVISTERTSSAAPPPTGFIPGVRPTAAKSRSACTAAPGLSVGTDSAPNPSPQTDPVGPVPPNPAGTGRLGGTAAARTAAGPAGRPRAPRRGCCRPPVPGPATMQGGGTPNLPSRPISAPTRRHPAEPAPMRRKCLRSRIRRRIRPLGRFRRACGRRPARFARYVGIRVSYRAEIPTTRTDSGRNPAIDAASPDSAGTPAPTRALRCRRRHRRAGHRRAPGAMGAGSAPPAPSPLYGADHPSPGRETRPHSAPAPPLSRAGQAAQPDTPTVFSFRPLAKIAGDHKYKVNGVGPGEGGPR